MRRTALPVLALVFAFACPSPEPSFATGETLLSTAELHARAERRWAEGELSAAEADFREVLARDPGHLWATVGLGHLSLSRGDAAAALTVFLRAEKLAAGSDAVEIRAAANRATEGLLSDGERESFLREGIARHGPAEPLFTSYVSFMKESGRAGTLENDLARLARETGEEAVAAARLELAAELGRNVAELSAELLARHPHSPAIARIAFTARCEGGDLAAAERIERTLRTRHPLDAAAMRARLSTLRGDTAEALLAAREVFAGRPDAASASALLSAALDSGDDGRDLVEAMRTIARAAPGDAAPFLPFVERALASRRDAFAQRIVNVVADLDPYGSAWPLLQAKCHLARGDRDAAIATFERAVEAERPSFELYLEMASLLREANRTAETRLVLARMFGLFPRPEERLRLLARAIETGAHEFALSVLESLRGNVDEYRLRKVFYDLPPGAFFAFRADPCVPRDDPFLLLIEGETRAAIGQHEEAFSLFDRVLAIAPNDRRALLAIGKARMERSEFDAAERALAAAATPGDGEADLLLGRARYLLGRYAQARETLERAARGGGLTASLLSALGRTHLALADTRALADLLAAGASAGLRIPGMLLDRLAPADVERVATEARGMADLDLAVIRFRLGRVRQEKGEHRLALQDFAAVSEAFPGLARIDRLRADSLFALGRTGEALLAASAALDAALDLPSAEARDAMLDSPYPCLTTVLAEAAIALGRFKEARAFLRTQVEGFRKGASDLAADPDIMRGDVTYLEAFTRRFALAGLPEGSESLAAAGKDAPPFSRALALLASGKGNVTVLREAEQLLVAGERDFPVEALYLRAYLEQERGRTAEAFKALEDALAKDEDLAAAARIAGAIGIHLSKK